MRARRLSAVSVTAALLAIFPLMAASAQVTDVLTTTKLGGANVAVGDDLRAGLMTGKQATFFAPGTTTGITCTKAVIGATVGSNPVKPGTSEESLDKATFTECSTNIPGATGVDSVDVTKLPIDMTISDATGFPVTVATVIVKATLATGAGKFICTYRAPVLSGDAAVGDQTTLAFTNQVGDVVKGSATGCPAKEAFSATYGPLKDFTVFGNPKVFVN